MDLRSRLCSMFKRPGDDPWSYEEEALLVNVGKRTDWESELSTLQEFRQIEPKWFPQSIAMLLGKWTSLLDRARNQPPMGNGQISQTDKIIWQKEYDEVVGQMKAIRDGYTGLQQWDRKDADKFNQLKARKTELKTKLGIVVG